MMQRVVKSLCWAGALVSVALWACSPRFSWRGGNRPGLSYREAVQRQTRTGQLFSNVDRRITVYATRLSPRLRELLAEEYQRVFGIPLASGRDELARGLKQAGEAEAYFLSVDFPNTADLGLEDPNGEWVLTLVAGGRASRARVYHLGRVARSRLRVFFPYVGNFTRNYLVDFPDAEPAGAGERILRLAGAPGRLELRWPS